MALPFRIDRERALATVISLIAGIAVFWIASVVFPYHSLNHDEGVYLQQAAMLLDGQLQLHAGELTDIFRPWFFVQDGGRFYPKYAPVPAAMYAISMALFGEPRVTLAAVAAGNAALVYVLASTLFDRRVGLLSAATFAAAPMALVTTSAFLPYAPTTFLNLVFAVCYVRSVGDASGEQSDHSRRRTRLGLAVVAGLAIGLAFFASPYTAVLFAAPFVGHALVSVGRALRQWDVASGDPRSLPEPIARNGLVAAMGLLGVAATLAYNAHLTGSPLVFPYETFAPLDGPGFGRREILGHSVEYTPALALEANAYALWYLATRWFTAGPLGTLCALLGVAVAVGRLRRGNDDRLKFGVAVLLGVAASVVVGNVPFWGTYNLLATMSDPTDGLVAQFGPFYHFDLLVPLSIFAAVGVVSVGRRSRRMLHAHLSEGNGSARRVRVLVLVALAVSLPLVGAANAAVLSPPLSQGAAVTDKYEQAYAPFDDREDELTNALVFLPTPYGPWQNHPFQYLRNDPGFDGDAVYALDLGAASRFDVIDAYPDRTYYRYTYRGEWTPNPDRHVTPKLEQLSVRDGNRLDGETRVGVPPRVERARVRLTAEIGEETVKHSIADPGDEIVVAWTIDSEAARVTTIDGNRVGDRDGGVAFDSPDELVMTVTLVQPDGSTLTYRQEAAVRTTADGAEVVWPPERSVCTLVTDCGREGTYLPDRPDRHRDGVSFETELRER